MAKFIPTVKKIYQVHQKIQREQDRQAKKAHAEFVRKRKAWQKEENARQKALEKQERDNERELIRLNKQAQKERLQAEKAHFQAVLERGKQALAKRVSDRQKLKERLLNI